MMTTLSQAAAVLIEVKNRDCLWCEEPVLDTERMVLMQYMGPESTEMRRFHHACSARSILGSLGHLKKTCHCYGGDLEDPPGLTKREAAEAAYRFFLEIEAPDLLPCTTGS
jgi:hypothetical protein